MDMTGHNPKSNSQVECMHQDLNTILRALVAEHGDPYYWEDILPNDRALFALRTAVCHSTGLAPNQILFGRDCSSLIDNIFGRPNNAEEIGIMSYLKKTQEMHLESA